MWNHPYPAFHGRETLCYARVKTKHLKTWEMPTLSMNVSNGKAVLPLNFSYFPIIFCVCVRDPTLLLPFYTPLPTPFVLKNDVICTCADRNISLHIIYSFRDIEWWRLAMQVYLSPQIAVWFSCHQILPKRCSHSSRQLQSPEMYREPRQTFNRFQLTVIKTPFLKR